MKQSACEIMKIKNAYTHHLNYFKTSLLFLSFLFCLNSTVFSQSSAIKTIVIDAGHGGKDPGCHGAFSNEKHVCLSMALKLGKKIKKNFPELNVLYTRDTDVFVELHERANIANKANADLFICIHANAASPAAYGTETYVLGLHRTEAQKNVAERENSIIHLEKDQGKRYENFDMSPDALIARKIQLSVFLDQSISFAQKLQRQFKNIGRHSRGVKQAGFLVLYKTTMPSVLIETGFLTNKKEEKFLAADEGQNKMVSAMFKAFVDHKNELEGVDKNVEEVANENNIELNESIQINNELENVDSSDIVFRVQIATSSKKLNLNSSKFKGLKVYEYFHNGSYKYTSGVFISNFKNANEHRDKMRKLGFKSSFVVCFKGDDRINLQKGIKLAEK